jgi:hypothetical protein
MDRPKIELTPMERETVNRARRLLLSSEGSRVFVFVMVESLLSLLDVIAPEPRKTPGEILRELVMDQEEVSPMGASIEWWQRIAEEFAKRSVDV